MISQINTPSLVRLYELLALDQQNPRNTFNLIEFINEHEDLINAKLEVDITHGSLSSWQNPLQIQTSTPGVAKDLSPLHFAIMCKHLEYAKLLIDSGADIRQKTDANETALILAAKYGFEDFIIYLLSSFYGAGTENEDILKAIHSYLNYMSNAGDEISTEVIEAFVDSANEKKPQVARIIYKHILYPEVPAPWDIIEILVNNDCLQEKSIVCSFLLKIVNKIVFLNEQEQLHLDGRSIESEITLLEDIQAERNQAVQWAITVHNNLDSENEATLNMSLPIMLSITTMNASWLELCELLETAKVNNIAIDTTTINNIITAMQLRLRLSDPNTAEEIFSAYNAALMLEPIFKLKFLLTDFIKGQNFDAENSSETALRLYTQFKEQEQFLEATVQRMLAALRVGLDAFLTNAAQDPELNDVISEFYAEWEHRTATIILRETQESWEKHRGMITDSLVLPILVEYQLEVVAAFIDETYQELLKNKFGEAHEMFFDSISFQFMFCPVLMKTSSQDQGWQKYRVDYTTAESTMSARAARREPVTHPYTREIISQLVPIGRVMTENEKEIFQQSLYAELNFVKAHLEETAEQKARASVGLKKPRLGI